NIEGLADSIRRAGGLINPITIDRNGQLVAGERRLMAVKLLGWDNVPVQFVDELDEPGMQLLELEENIRRVDLPWPDQCLAVHRYQELRRGRDPKWTRPQTAEALGMSNADVSEKLDVASQILNGNTQVIQAPQYSTALGIVRRDKHRRAASELEHFAA